jgi:hypothetical protein
METYETILEILSAVLLIIGIIYRKKSWGQKILYFALGMIAVLILTEGVEGWNEGINLRK